MNEIEDKIKTPKTVIALKEKYLTYLGTLIFIIGVIFCFSSVVYIVINQLSLSNLQNIYQPLTITGIGAVLILAGTNVVLKPENIYVCSVIAPQILLSFLSMIMLWADYPKSWHYPSVGYLFSFYTLGILLLIGNVSVNVGARIESSREEKGIEKAFIINEEPKPLRYWTSDENGGIGEVLQSDVCNLIVKCEDLKASLEKEQRAAKSDVKKLLLSSLEVVDTFDALFKKIDQKKSEVDRQTKIWLGNFQSIKRLAERVLADTGVSQIETPSGKAIPGLHRIVATKEMQGLEDYTIVEEMEKGYLWQGEVLRKSNVVVVKNRGGTYGRRNKRRNGKRNINRN